MLGYGKISRDQCLTAAPPQHANRLPNEIFLPPQRIYHNARRGCTIEIRDVAYITQHKQILFDRASSNATMRFTSYVLKFKFYYGRFDGLYEAKSNANKRFVKIVTFIQHRISLFILPYCMNWHNSVMCLVTGWKTRVRFPEGAAIVLFATTSRSSHPKRTGGSTRGLSDGSVELDIHI